MSLGQGLVVKPCLCALLDEHVGGRRDLVTALNFEVIGFAVFFWEKMRSPQWVSTLVPRFGNSVKLMLK